jgi:hypothetical protein
MPSRFTSGATARGRSLGPQDVLRVGQARRAALGAFVEPVRTDDDEDSVSRGDVLEDLRQVIGAHGEVVDVLPHAVFAVAQHKMVAKAPGPAT